MWFEPLSVPCFALEDLCDFKELPSQYRFFQQNVVCSRRESTALT